jgi:hypothetical protein
MLLGKLHVDTSHYFARAVLLDFDYIPDLLVVKPEYHHWALPWATVIHLSPSQPISLLSVFQAATVARGFPMKSLCAFIVLPHPSYILP